MDRTRFYCVGEKVRARAKFYCMGRTKAKFYCVGRGQSQVLQRGGEDQVQVQVLLCGEDQAYFHPISFLLSPLFLSLTVYGLRLVRTAAIKTDNKLTWFFSFIQTILSLHMDWLASRLSVPPPFYRFIYPVSSGGGGPCPSSSSMVDRSAKRLSSVDPVFHSSQAFLLSGVTGVDWHRDAHNSLRARKIIRGQSHVSSSPFLFLLRRQPFVWLLMERGCYLPWWAEVFVARPIFQSMWDVGPPHVVFNPFPFPSLDQYNLC